MKDSWTHKRLKEVVSFISDGDWIESRHQSESGIRLIQTGNVGNGKFKAKDDKPHYISETTFDEIGCTEIFEGDCLVSRLPEPVGRACIIPNVGNRMITAVDCSILRFSPVILSRYFVYYSQSSQYQREIVNNTTGTTRKRISRKNLESVKVPVPSLKEQERIVAELDLLTGIIDKQRAQLRELDTLARSIFYDMFGDPVENEKQWKKQRLGDYCEVSSSKRVLVKDVVNSGIPFLRGTELTALNKASSSEDVNFSMFITPEHYKKVKTITGVPKKGDILIPSINSEGITWIVDTDEPFYFKDGRVLWIHMNTKTFSSEYLKFAISGILKSTYDTLTSGATFLELKLFIIRDLPIPIPPLNLQQSFARKIASIESQKSTITRSIAETQKLFDYTMDKYFG